MRDRLLKPAIDHRRLGQFLTGDWVKNIPALTNRLEEYSFIKIVNKVELSIVTFTIDGFDRERLLLLTGALFKSNQAFITVTQVGGMDALRCAIINYETTESMLDDIVFSIINEAKKIRAISE
jgi:glutamate/tyrosine decarboxylase-like PLP-dependent enzyme